VVVVVVLVVVVVVVVVLLLELLELLPLALPSPPAMLSLLAVAVPPLRKSLRSGRIGRPQPWPRRWERASAAEAAALGATRQAVGTVACRPLFRYGGASAGPVGTQREYLARAAPSWCSRVQPLRPRAAIGARPLFVVVGYPCLAIALPPCLAIASPCAFPRWSRCGRPRATRPSTRASPASASATCTFST